MTCPCPHQLEPGLMAAALLHTQGNSGPLRTLKTTQDQPGPVKTSQDHPGPVRTSQTTQDHSGLLRTTQTYQDRSRTLSITQDHSGSLKTTQDHSGPLRITQEHSAPLLCWCCSRPLVSPDLRSVVGEAAAQLDVQHGGCCSDSAALTAASHQVGTDWVL